MSVMFLGCICKDGIGTITDVEGNINSAKYIDILDNNLLPVILKFENYQWIFHFHNESIAIRKQTVYDARLRMYAHYRFLK